MYGLRRPHRERVLSDMKPMTGSVMASTSRGRKNRMPHSTGSIPRPLTSTTMKIASAAGNIWLPSMPIPKAIFWPSGILSSGAVA